jgi:exonuclease SbcC
MKPIKLIISAFGPYGTTMPEINFEQFEDKGIFLISGDTGAGKTTIFDAICYALYGTTSGSYRDTKNLRSEYARDDIKSYVEFHFSHQGNNYWVRRQPSYERKKQRGEGMITEGEKAVFCQEGEVPVEGVKEVGNAVRELLHIDDKQFKQIAMIAQGEFWELLNAKTDKRTEILRKVFSTDCYQDIEGELKRRMDESADKKKSIENSIVQYFNDVRADESEEAGELDHMLENKQQELINSKSLWDGVVKELLELIEQLVESDENLCKAEQENLAKVDQEYKEKQNVLATAKMNNEAIITFEKLTAERQELEEKKKDIEEESELLERKKAATREVYPKLSALETKTGEIGKTQEDIASNRQALESARLEAEKAAREQEKWSGEQPQVEEFRLQMKKISEELPKYQERDELVKRLVVLKRRLEEIEVQQAKCQDDESKLVKRIEELKTQKEDLKNRPEELLNTENTYKSLATLLEKMKAVFVSQIPEYNRLLATKQEKQQLFIDVRDKYEVAQKVYENAERRLENSRAGLLALKLVEGKACPVCGSKSHPVPAQLSEDAITEEELKRLKDSADKLRSRKEAALVDVEKANEAEEQNGRHLKNSLQEQLKEYEATIVEIDKSDYSEKSSVCDTDGSSSLKNLSDRLNAAYDVAKSELERNKNLIIDLRRDCDTLKRVEQALEKGQDSDKKELEARKEKLAQQANQARMDAKEAEVKLESFANLRYEKLEEAEHEYKRISAEATKLERCIQAAEENKKSADLRVAELDSAIRTFNSTLEKQRADQSNLAELLNQALALKNFESQDDMRGYVVSESEIKTAEDRIAMYMQRVETNSKMLEAARKNASGKSRIDIDELTATCRTLDNMVNNKRKTVDEIKSRIDNNKRKYENIKAKQQEYEVARGENNTCSTLYKMVKGTTNNGKITLEQYIQAAGFDGIIAAANRRLLPMSDGQYELYRRSGNLGRQSNTFLDLEVLDNYTGHRRPVGNLSGGESFKASLSLALGLSDTVSSNLGGIQMDALFVDEGFGTLDRKSIDNAMDILINLSGANKLVGIISHREELVENIPQQIKVRKTKSGSEFTVELGI